MILTLLLVQLPTIVGLFEDPTLVTNNLKIKYNYGTIPEGPNENLYNIFKGRLQRIQQELTYHKLNDDLKQTEEELNDNLLCRFAKGHDKHSDCRQASFYNCLCNRNCNIYDEKSTSNFSGTDILNENSFNKLSSFENNGSIEMLSRKSNSPKLTSNENLHNNNLDYSEKQSEVQHIPSNIVKFHSSVHRREAAKTNTSTSGNSSTYPSVLTKALQISLNPTTNTKSSGNFLANVAQQMNTSTIGLAKELTKTSATLNDDMNMNKIFKNYASNNDLPEPVVSDNNEHLMGITSSNMEEILGKVLMSLEQIHKDRLEDNEDLPDGIPCDILGTWSSSAMGLHFDIQQQIKDKMEPIELNNIILTIEVHDCIPPKPHQFMDDLDWKFEGSAIKKVGGPLHMYAQKRNESLIGTFLGFCRTCRGTDTIFGSWSFLSPSKNCMDISMAFDVKNDLLHRVRFKSKRKKHSKVSSRVGKYKD